MAPAVPVGSPEVFLISETNKSGVAEPRPEPICTLAVVPVPAACRFKFPKVVPQVEVAPPVKVRAPPEVKEEAEVGVKLTAPAPEAVKFPEVKIKDKSVELAVVITPPLL